MGRQDQHGWRSVRAAALALAIAGSAAWLNAQQQQPPRSSPDQTLQQDQQKQDQQKQDQQKQPPKPSDQANPFPGDSDNVPVIPTSGQPAPDANAAPAPPAALPSGDADPVRSPDDPVGNAEGSGSDSFSSSSAGMDRVTAPPPDRESRDRRGQKNQPAPEHQETAKEDESVGSYYLSQKNWHAALSRYESAVVLDPENPDVYWGLAESQRHLGQFLAAKGNYQKVMAYDPDSKHAKESKKLLSTPELANAPVASSAPPGP